MDTATELVIVLKIEPGRTAQPSKRGVVTVTKRDISKLFARQKIDPEVSQQVKLKPVVLIKSLKMMTIQITYRYTPSVWVNLLH